MRETKLTIGVHHHLLKGVSDVLVLLLLLSCGSIQPKETPAPTEEATTLNLVAAENGGQVVSTTDELDCCPASNLIDGYKLDGGEWWTSEPPQFPQVVVFTLAGGGARTIDHVVLNPWTSDWRYAWIEDFSLYVSTTSPDPAAMGWVGLFTLDHVGIDQTFSFDPVRARYIALVVNSHYGSAEGITLNEFEVYEAPPDAVPVEPAQPGPAGGARGAGETKEAEPPASGTQSSGAGPELPPESPPETTTVLTDFLPRTLATSGASPLENIEFETDCTDLVPVIYHLYGTYFESLVQTRFTNHNSRPVKVRVEAGIPNYTDTAVETLDLGPGETVEVDQNPPLTPGALDLLHGMKKATLHVQIDYLKGGEKLLLYEGTEPVTIYSRDDFPWGIPGYYNGTIFLATMVTPNDPALDDLLRAAADYMPGGIITFGYDDESDSNGSVWDRMKAIYDTVAEKYNVIYVATGIPFVTQQDEAEGFTLQRLKLPYEVLESHSGMCVELSALFASVFEKLLLHPIILTLPGHVYVGVPLSWDSSTYYFLETTLVGRASFEEAVQKAGEEFEEMLPYLEEDRLDDYFWLDVADARQEGIWPIPWR